MIYCVANIILTQYAPSFHGFYRAIISTPFTWSVEEWTELTANLKMLLLPEVVDHLNDLLPQSLQSTEADPEDARFIHIFLSRYVSQDRPLTGYFIVCCVMEIIWTVLAQTLSPPSDDETTPTESEISEEEEAAAANEVWDRLMRKAVDGESSLESSQETLLKVSGYAIRCFSDLLLQIEDMDTEPSIDTYAWETMSESLVSFLLPRLKVQRLILSPEIGISLFYCTSRTKQQPAYSFEAASKRGLSYLRPSCTRSCIKVDDRSRSKVRH